jgi:uncharacterized membrane protein YuzA (DUF378 family)
MKTLQIITLTLVIIGAVNWGFVGLFGFDIVAGLFGGAKTTMSTVVYSIIGLAGIINIGLLVDMFEDLDHDHRK